MRGRFALIHRCLQFGFAGLLLCAASAVQAQTLNGGKESSQMSQLRQAIALAQSGDEAQALSQTNFLVERNPNYHTDD